MKTMMVDLSKWDTKVNYGAFKDAGLEAVIARAGGSKYDDPQVRVHVAGTRSIGLACGLYYWVDPLRDGVEQATHLCRLMSELAPDFIAADVEQWWANWDLWYAWILGKISRTQVPVLPPRRIYRTVVDFYNATPTSVKKLIYSRISFLTGFCKDLIPFVVDKDCWLAQYPPTGGNLLKRKLTWDELKERFLPTTEPAKLVGMNEVALWQWTGDRFTLPGTGRRTDVNLWMKEQPFEVWLGHKIQEPNPVPYTEARLASWVYALNVREAPWLTVTPPPILRVILRNEIIRVDPGIQRVGKWVKLWGELGWCHSGYLEYL